MLSLHPFRPSLRLGTRDVRASSSLHSSAGTLRRIPQAVGAVATPYEGWELTLHEFQYRKR